MNADVRLVFIHGYGGGPEDWDALRRCLGSQHPQTIVTLPGHGDRASDLGPFSIERCATEVLETLNDVPAILIGHSMGTLIAMEVACRSSDKIAGLVLVDGSNAPASRQEITAEFQGRVARLGFEKAMDWTFSTMLVDQLSKKTQAMMYARIRALPPEAALDYDFSMAEWDRDCFGKCQPSLEVPVKVIQSTSLVPSRGWVRKPVCEFPNSLWLDSWRQVSSADITAIKDCGHYVMIEQPKPVSEVIMLMIAKLGTITSKPSFLSKRALG